MSLYIIPIIDKLGKFNNIILIERYREKVLRVALKIRLHVIIKIR